MRARHTGRKGRDREPATRHEPGRGQGLAIRLARPGRERAAGRGVPARRADQLGGVPGRPARQAGARRRSRRNRQERTGHERADWSELQADIFGEEFLLARPLLAAIRAPDPVVLLIDEVDRLDAETEALLLEVLSDYQVSIPEFGTVTSTQTPLVFLTSNNSRELSEALKRRCLYLYIDYPAPERERDIVLSRVPGFDVALAGQVAGVVRSLRQLELKKRPSVSESIDWARTLFLLGAEEISTDLVIGTLHVLLKHQSDIEKATTELRRAR